MRSWYIRWLGVGLLVVGATVVATSFFGASASADGERGRIFRVVVPEEDRFTPFALTIHVGDVVEWINKDTDDHTIVSDDTFNTTGHNGVNHLLPGTDSNGGQPGRFRLRFVRPGAFVYYCRFHSHLDLDAQPVAPGPDGGIQDSKGNFGTPMSGVVTVLAFDDGDHKDDGQKDDDHKN